MALITCSDCGKEISGNAASCPNCGNPLKAVPPSKESAKTKKKGGWGKWVGIVLAISLIISIFSKNDEQSTSLPQIDEQQLMSYLENKSSSVKILGTSKTSESKDGDAIFTKYDIQYSSSSTLGSGKILFLIVRNKSKGVIDITLRFDRYINFHGMFDAIVIRILEHMYSEDFYRNNYSKILKFRNDIHDKRQESELLTLEKVRIEYLQRRSVETPLGTTYYDLLKIKPK
jgi:hypothetical protein